MELVFVSHKTFEIINYMTIGKVYLSSYKTNIHGSSYYLIVNDIDLQTYINVKYFKPLADVRNDKLNKLI